MLLNRTANTELGHHIIFSLAHASFACGNDNN